MPTDEQCKPMRQKYWSELDDHGRIERMRQEIRHLKSQNKQIIESMRQLLIHVHNKDGKPLLPIEPAFGSQLHGYFTGSGEAASNDDVYF